MSDSVPIGKPSGCPGEGVIVDPSPPKRDAASKRWCFTWNNFPEDWLSTLSRVFTEEEWIGVPEIGNEKTPHIQGYVEFHKAVRPVEYTGLHCGNVGLKWLKAKGTQKHNQVYIGKTHNKVCAWCGATALLHHAVFGKDLLNGQWEEKWPEPDWCGKCKKEDSYSKGTYGKSFGTIKPKKGPRELKHPEMDRPWQIYIRTLLEAEPDDRTIHWFYGNGNIGKTTFTKYLVTKHGACLLQGKGADVRNGVCTYLKDHKEYPEVCVWNIPRSYNSEYLSYEALESVKDMCFYSGKYEGGTVVGPCPHLIVFSNEEPDREKMSADRWKVFRITDGGEMDENADVPLA